MFREAARRLEVVLVEKPVQTVEEAQATLAQISKRQENGWDPDPPRDVSLNIPGFTLEAASQQGSRRCSVRRSRWTRRLASYGPDFHETGRQAARLVDKILKGWSRQRSTWR